MSDKKLFAQLKTDEYLLILAYFKEQNPALYLDLVTRVIPKIIQINEYKEEIADNKQRLQELNDEIRRSNKVVYAENAIIGSSEQKEWVSNITEHLQKAGLAVVPIVTLFAITGVTSILNPFVNPHNSLGVLFILLSSVSFVFLTSSAIVKLVCRLNRRHWQHKFWNVKVQHWFAFGCILFGFIEGLGGGALASNLIDRATAAANEFGNTNLPMLDFWGQVKIIGIISLFAYINIYFSISKGVEIRILQPSKIRRNKALSQLETAKEIKQQLSKQNQELTIKVEQLFKEIAFAMSSEEIQRVTRNMSNQNTLGQDFKGKNPGTYALSNQVSTNGNGRHNLNSIDEIELNIKDLPAN